MLVKNSLKSSAISGFFWNALERFSVTIGQFLIGIVLARLLTPDDFGLIGMLSIFIAVSQVFIQSGLGSGLIQNQDRSDKDFSTVFVFNLVVSFLFYTILFLLAPFIASFYNMPQLTLMTRVLGIILIINSLSIVQRIKLEIEVNFKLLAKINVIAIVVGGVIGITTALLNFGVWSLVFQTISISVITAIGLWLIGNWKLSLIFSKNSFKKLFGFGSKLLIAGVFATSLKEVYNLAIGKFYMVSQLGCFSQAKKFADTPTGLLSSIFQKVSFPILSSLQNDRKKMLSVYKRILSTAAFFTFPALSILAILTSPLILLLLGEKWMLVVPLLQWFCLARLFIPMSIINLSVLNAIGRSDLFLKVDLLKAPIIIIALIITIPISIEAVVIGQIFTSFFSYLINTYYSSIFFKYGAIKQIRDSGRIIISTILMTGITLFCLSFFKDTFLKIFIGLLVSIVTYVFMAYLLKVKELGEIKNIVKERLWK